MTLTMPSAKRTTKPPRAGDSLVLFSVPWRVYEDLTRLFADRRLRITYDRGALEIMTVSLEHEDPSYLLGQLVDVLAEQLDMTMRPGRTLPLRNEALERGLEPDNCYWLRNYAKIKGVKEFVLGKHPPPDLAIEVDVTSSSIPRMPIYEKLRVPEVWRASGNQVRIFLLRKEGAYEEAANSAAFAGLPANVLTRFLKLRRKLDHIGIARQFRAWVRKHLKS